MLKVFAAILMLMGSSAILYIAGSDPSVSATSASESSWWHWHI